MKLTDANVNTLRSLLKDLKLNFPSSIPINREVSLEEIRRLQGQQEIIQYIDNMIDAQDEDDIESLQEEFKW